MNSHTIIAAFRTIQEAEAVSADLRSAGISEAAIQVHKQSYSESGADTALLRTEPAEHKSGFWSWLTSETEVDHEHTLYDETITGGGAVLSVIVADEDSGRVISVLESHDPITIDAQAEAAHVGYVDPVMARAPVMGTSDAASTASAKTVHAATPAAAGEVLALAEESLSVGKRQVDSGTARIRRFVVERPVEEQIRLRSESVRIDRRPVTGDGRVAADAFSEKVIEFKETAEEAVVAKTARVVEEVVVGKDVHERVETVRDTVRREDVEVTPASAANKPLRTAEPVVGKPGY